MPTPPPMQMMPLQFAQQPQSPFGGDQMKNLAKNLGAAIGPQGLAGLGQQPGVPGTPGAAVPGATGPTSYGGPQGPMPLVPPGTQAPSAFPTPQPGQGQSIGQDLARNLSPPQLLGVLQQASRTGVPISQLLPGGAAPATPGVPPWATTAGMLPGG